MTDINVQSINQSVTVGRWSLRTSHYSVLQSNVYKTPPIPCTPIKKGGVQSPRGSFQEDPLLHGFARLDGFARMNFPKTLDWWNFLTLTFFIVERMPKIDQRRGTRCPKCGGCEVRKNGLKRCGGRSPAQRYKCKTCGYQFVEEWIREPIPAASWEITDRLIRQGKLKLRDIAAVTGISLRAVYHRKTLLKAGKYE
jgi:transposase-like protein